MISYILNVLVILILIGIFFSVTKICIIDLTSFFSVKGIPTFKIWIYKRNFIPNFFVLFFEIGFNNIRSNKLWSHINIGFDHFVFY